jgi:predicted nucleotidyltransferase
MPPDAVLAALRALLDGLAPFKLRSALVGGLALAVWKHPRFTKDVDLLIALGDIDATELLHQLSPLGFRPKHAPDLVKLGELEILQLIYAPPEAFVDVQVDLLLANDSYQRGALARSIEVELPECDLSVAVLSCEDLILHKLIAGRMIDMADAAALCRANRDALDWAYLRPWADDLEVGRELAQVWDEAFPGERLPEPRS